MDNGWQLDQHWKVVASGGRQISTTAQQLWEGAVSYFKWCEDNPIKAKRTLTSGKEAGKQVETEYTRPYTVKGFCLHCGISERYIKDISTTHQKDSEYYIVMEKILMLIYNQVLEGALLDLYNPIMASKLLNMDKETDNQDAIVKIEVVHTGKTKLANSENEILEKLNLEKLEILKDKIENS